MDITQACLLEKALGGCVDVENEVVNSRTDLAIDPNPPTPPPPPAPAMDVVVLLDISDECVATRAVSQRGMLQPVPINAMYLCASSYFLLMCTCIHAQVIICMYYLFVGGHDTLVSKASAGTDTDTAANTTSTEDNLFQAQIPHR